MSPFELISVVIAVVALCGYLNYKFIHLPDTIGITAVALLISLIMAGLGLVYPEMAQRTQTVIGSLDFPELVFHGLLGLLLFAGSLHVDLAALARARWTIVLLATIGVVLSTALIGGASFLVTRVVGIPLSLTDCLIFGALISPTDPIAALGVLSKAGVPPTLLTKITGEALFNDGTGVVIFMTLTAIASGSQALSPGGIAELLVREVVGGITFGLVLGLGGVWLLKGVDSYAVETLITLAMATGGYAAADAAHVSAPIAAVVMGLFVGNHGRLYAMSEQTRERLFNFWELTDDLLNLLLFGLLGLELMALSAQAHLLVGPALLAIPIVLIARAVSVAVPIMMLRPFQKFEPHTVKLLTWTGLRGALSVALALSLPPGKARDTIVAATYLVAVFSILVQATTVERLARRWTRRGKTTQSEASPQSSPPYYGA
jgi:CPA1 family monovalent cation:H+ antiporter